MRKVLLCLLLVTLPLLAGRASAVGVDLSTFPDTLNPVPNNTVLSDQWRTIGILFDALPSGIDPIKQDFGGSSANIFFSPDNAGATAVFTFVLPGTAIPAFATSFSLEPFFNPSESAQLVGIAANGSIVDSDSVTPADIGASNQSIRMSISGEFARVEWRTQGNPGIAADEISFELGAAIQANPVPTLSSAAMFFLIFAVFTVGVLYRRKYV